MSNDPNGGPGLGDLEKELTCSVSDLFISQPQFSGKRGADSRIETRLFAAQRPLHYTLWRNHQIIPIQYQMTRKTASFFFRSVALTAADLHRFALSAAHPPRLPPYFLRLLPERMVLHPSISSLIILSLPIHLPIMPRKRPRDSSKCHSYHPVGHGSDRQPRPRQASC